MKSKNRGENFGFRPWIGSDYENGFNRKKILILGESHYCCNPGECDGCIDQTNEIIKKQIDESRDDFESNRFYTKLAKLFLGKVVGQHISLDEKISFWNSVAFYNYIQMSVGNNAGIAPTEEMFEKSWESFQRLIEEIKPDFILIVSQRLWEGLPGIAGEDWPPGPVNYSYFYRGKATNPLCVIINHPSSPHFSYEIGEVIFKALDSIS
jgi:hypothetical protein